MRDLARETEQRLRERITGLRGTKVRVGRVSGVCPVCGGASRVRKTGPRQGRTLRHGQFEAWETVTECATGCRYPSGDRVTPRAAVLVGELLPRRVVGYDVMVFVGRQRYLEHRQREEIRTALMAEYGISLSAGEVSNLAKVFLDYMRRLHTAHAKELCAALMADGGWPLHIDATGEDGRGTLFVTFAGWRRWVLGAWKLPTERADAIVPCLRDVTRQFGMPCAVVRDLGRAMTSAVNEWLAEEGIEIPVLACHGHFLKDIGKDLLEPSHAALRATFRALKVRPRLRSLSREIGRKLGGGVESARQDVRVWLAGTMQNRSLPKGMAAGLGTVRAVAQWVLDYQDDSSGADFPFDRPYLDLYDRCTLALQAIKGFLKEPPAEQAVVKALQRLWKILAPMDCDLPLQPHALRLSYRAKLFDELRNALRLVPPTPEKQEAKVRLLEAEMPAGELLDIREEVEALVRSLRTRREQYVSCSDQRQAIDIILRHIKDHGESLWGHEIKLPAEQGGGSRLVERTNNDLEGFFRGIKHDERRRSGRKVLTQDFEHLPPEAALARNLRHPDYVEVVCGDIDDLPKAFAELDAEERRRRLAGETSATEKHRPSDFASASLPREDKRLVRTEAMKQRLLAAAGS